MTGSATGQTTPPTFTLTPTHGVPGANIKAEGDGFGDFAEVTLYIDSMAAANELADGTLSSGSFTVNFPVPSKSPGAHTVIACVHTSGASACRQQASATLTIDQPPTTTQATTTTVKPTTTTTPAQATTTTQKPLGIPTTTNPGDPPAPGSTFPLGAVTTTASPQFSAGEIDNPDLTVRYIEITQAIQNFDNDMPLVADRRTVVRVYPVTDNGPHFEWPDIDGAIQVVRGNKNLVIYPENGPISTHSVMDRTNLDHSLNFIVPSAYIKEGQTKFRVLLWYSSPAAIENEPNPINNLKEITKTFHKGEDPFLIVLPMDPSANPGDEPSAATMTGVPVWMGNNLLDFHPVAAPGFQVSGNTVTPGAEAAEPGIWDLTADRDEPLVRLASLHALWALDDEQKLTGVFNASLPADGYTGWSIPSYYSFWTKEDDATAAHEMGHDRGLGHTGCKDTNPADGIADEIAGGGLDKTHPNALPKCSLAPVDTTGFYGLTVYRSPMTVYSNDPDSPAAGFPMMSYMGPKWADAYHYCKLLTAYGIPCSPSGIGVPGKSTDTTGADCKPKNQGAFTLELCIAADPKDPVAQYAKDGKVLIGVTGKIQPISKTAKLGKVTINQQLAASSVPEPPDISPFRLSTYDNAGALLTRVPLNVDLPGQGHGKDNLADPDSAGFFQQFVAVGEIASLKIEQADGTVLDTRTASANAPTVAVNVPAPADVADRDFDLTWTMADADGDPLLATVLWSNDNFKTWQPVADGVAGTSVHVSSNSILPGGRVRVKVIVSDGLRNTEANSRTFTVPEAEPLIAVSGPTAPVARYDIVRLAASAVDPEDGVLRNVTWSDSIDGSLGRGNIVETRKLSLGDHVVTASATDGDGNKVTGQIAFSVIDTGRAAPRGQGAEPDAEARFRLAAATGDDDSGAPIVLIIGGIVLVVLAVAGFVVARRRRASATP